jgi:hypothetical protein
MDLYSVFPLIEVAMSILEKSGASPKAMLAGFPEIELHGSNY